MQRMAMRMTMKSECTRCGAETADEICEGCASELAVYLDQRAAKVPHCGLCGDTGRLPAGRPLGWAASLRFDEIDETLICTDCPCCPACGVEYRHHADLAVCP